MNAIVTGGAGFIGSHLLDALHARGDDAVCIERPGASRRWIAHLPVPVVEIDLAQTKELARRFDGVDVVFHLAGLTHARVDSDYYAVNTEGTARVLEAAAARGAAAPRVVLVSSLAALGPCRNGDLLSPRSVPYPLSHYGQSKLLAEAVVHAFADHVPATILRFASVYGPREAGILKVFRLVQRGIALTIGGWDREASLLYARDAVQALLAAGARASALGRTYCVAHPEPVTWGEFARAIGRALGKRPRLLSVPPCVARGIALAAEWGARRRGRATILSRDRLRDLAQARWVCDSANAVAELGFRPEYDLDRGVRETAAWYREAGWI